jgi:hypothetical protein
MLQTAWAMSRWKRLGPGPTLGWRKGFCLKYSWRCVPYQLFLVTRVTIRVLMAAKLLLAEPTSTSLHLLAEPTCGVVASRSGQRCSSGLLALQRKRLWRLYMLYGLGCSGVWGEFLRYAELQ